MTSGPTARFLGKVDSQATPRGCWLWTGTVIWSGYGHFWMDGKNRLAHRVAYEMFVGPIPEGLTLDHLCHTTACKLTTTCPHRRCVRPSHLLACSTRENSLRGNTLQAANVAKTHCPQGHPYEQEGTLGKDGRRTCRACAREYAARKRVLRPRAPKTECPWGHPYEGDNRYINAKGYVECRACRRVSSARSRLRRGDDVTVLEAL